MVGKSHRFRFLASKPDFRRGTGNPKSDKRTMKCKYRGNQNTYCAVVNLRKPQPRSFQFHFCSGCNHLLLLVGKTMAVIVDFLFGYMNLGCVDCAFQYDVVPFGSIR